MKHCAKSRLKYWDCRSSVSILMSPSLQNFVYLLNDDIWKWIQFSYTKLWTTCIIHQLPNILGHSYRSLHFLQPLLNLIFCLYSILNISLISLPSSSFMYCIVMKIFFKTLLFFFPRKLMRSLSQIEFNWIWGLTSIR